MKNLWNVVKDMANSGLINKTTTFLPLTGNLKECVAVVNDGLVEAIAGESGWSHLYLPGGYVTTKTYPSLLQMELAQGYITTDVLPDELLWERGNEPWNFSEDEIDE